MFDRFTDRARKTMGLARQESQRLNHEYIGTEHVLLGLVAETSGVASQVLRDLGVDLVRVQTEVEKLVKSGGKTVTMGQLPFTPRVKKALEVATAEGQALGHGYIGTEHLLLGLLKVEDGVAYHVLVNCGVSPEEVRGGVLELLGQPECPVEVVREPTFDVLGAWHIKWGKDTAGSVSWDKGTVEDVTEAVRAGQHAAHVIRRLAAGDKSPDLLERAESLAEALSVVKKCRACGGEKAVDKWHLTQGWALARVGVPCPDCCPSDSHARWVRFRYRNYKGKESVRRAVPGPIYWGKTEWHPEEQWLFRAWDLDKGEARDFALKDVLAWGVPAERECPDCKGKGWPLVGNENSCRACGGSGMVDEKEE